MHKPRLWDCAVVAAAPEVSPAGSPTMSDLVQFNSRKEMTVSPSCLKLKLYFMGLYLTACILHGSQGLGWKQKL